uniref:Uncharacterized protein n=1 Tax=Tanacetum cinerariifolium TaxID=118510 RepID=A0A699IMR6_TANCI|nr:hypothetical protein [Tanacetum cinerariifolium]
MSKFRQTNQFAEAISSTSGIADNYLASKMKDVVGMVVQLQTNKFKEEAQAKNQEFLNQVDPTMQTIIKEQVQAQVSKIIPKIKKCVTESLGAKVLVRSTNQPQTSYAVEASLSKFELKKILIDKMKENQSRGRDDQDKDKDHSAGSNRGSNGRRSDKEAELSQEPTHKESKHKIIAVTSLKIKKYFGYSHLEEIIVKKQDDKLSNLNLEERYALNVALRMFTRRIVIQECVEDLQLRVESYQKKINLIRPGTYRSDLKKMTPYTAYLDIQGIIYEDKMNRNRLMRTDELHKFSDGTLNHVHTALNDIATQIKMDYLPKRK